MGKVGGPRAKIDWVRVDKLARAHCSATGIAKVLGYSCSTLSRNIEYKYKMQASDYLHERRQEGTALMREAIYNAGIKGNIIAQIFWLKNRDGWADKAIVQHEVLPPVQISLPAGVDKKEAKMIEAFFNGQKNDNERILQESESLPEWTEVDN